MSATLSEFSPALTGFRLEEFLALTESLLVFPIEQDPARLDVAPFRLERPEPVPEAPMEPLPPRRYPRPAPAIIEAARASLTPLPRPAILEGRAPDLARVLRPLLAGHPVQVRGEPGVGKTALLATVAIHERTRRRFRRVWWIDRPDRLHATLALALDLPHVLAERDPARRRAWLAEHLDDHTLLIIDNLPEQPGPEATGALLDDLTALTAHVLVAVETSPELPDPDQPPIEDPEGVVTLRALEDTAAIDALAAHAGIEDARRLRGELLRIATALGHHPYALMLAGKLVRLDGLSLAELDDVLVLEPLLEARAAVTAPDAESDAESDDGDNQAAAVHAASLNRALDVSIEALPGEYRQLFEAFGAFPPAGAPFDGLHELARLGSQLATRRGLIALAEYGFIRRDHRDPEHYVMHPVAYARAATTEEHPAQDKRARRMRAWALRYVRERGADPLALYRAEPGLLHAYTTGQQYGPPHVAEPLADELQPYLHEYAPDMLTADAPAPDPGGPRAEAAHLTGVGLELTGQGATVAAEEALTRALKLRRAHDSDHAIAETLTALGRLYDLDGRYAQAAEALIEAAELVYRLGADESLSVIRRGLARAYRHLGRLEDALGVLDDSPPAHLERAAILRAQSRYAAAVQEMALAERATPYARAEIYVLAGQYAEALEAIAEQDDPASAHLRAQVYHLQGDVDKAIEGYRRALDCAPADDPAQAATRAKTLRGLGAALASAGQHDAARETLEAALSIHHAQPKLDALLVGRTLRLLAAVHLAAGDAPEAASTARDALDRLRHVSAPDETADACRTLGRALWQQGDPAGARDAFEREVEAAQSSPARDEARIGIALHHLSDAYHATGELDRAIANYRRALTHHDPVAAPRAYFMTQLALHRALLEAERLPAALDLAQEMVDHLNGGPEPPDLVHLGYAHALRARTQQAVERPIRARQTVLEWCRALIARAEDALSDPRPAVRALLLGLAARSLLAADQPDEALPVAQLGQAVTRDHFPNTPVAWAAIRDLGEVYLALDRPEEAILTLEPLLIEAVKEDPATYALAYELSGRGYRAIDEPENAIDHLSIALAHEPDQHRRGLLQATIGHIQLDTGQPETAVESLRAALPLFDRESHPDVVAQTLTTLAHTLGGLNRYADAINVYEDALAALREVAGTDPRHTADVLRSLGETHEAQGQLPEAAHAYRRALNILERVDAPRQYRDILHRLARVAAAQDDPGAVQLYEQTRGMTEQWGDTQQLAGVIRELADAHLSAGRLPLAAQNYLAALEHQPAQLMARDRAHTLRNLGRAYAQLERYDEARAAWTEALDLSASLPDHSPEEIALTHHAIGEAHRSQGHYEDAERSYREALSHHRAGSVPAAETWRALGLALQAAGRSEEAVEPLQTALEIEKSQPQQANARLVRTLQALAEICEDIGDLEVAIARQHEALVYMDRDLQPVAYAETLRTLGALYVEAENWRQAHQALDEALQIESERAPRSDERISATLQAIADTYRAQGDLEKAAEFYQKVTVYANLARRASQDLRETLDELERRRATLQAAQQSLALLDRSDEADLKDTAFIYALIAHSHAQLNQPGDCDATVETLLGFLAEHAADLDPDDAQPDARALAWLLAAQQAQGEGDLPAARDACQTALDAATNSNLRWVIARVAEGLV